MRVFGLTRVVTKSFTTIRFDTISIPIQFKFSSRNIINGRASEINKKSSWENAIREIVKIQYYKILKTIIYLYILSSLLFNVINRSIFNYLAYR